MEICKSLIKKEIENILTVFDGQCIMKRKIYCVLILVILSGCATRKEIVKFKNDATYLCSQVETLRLENKEIKKMLVELNKSVNNLSEETQRSKADMLTEIDNLKSKSQIIESKIEDTSYRMSGFLQKQLKENTEHDSSLATNNQNIQTGSEKDNINPKEIYNMAYIDLSKSNYQLAIAGFQEYLNRFPQSELADNAQYWIGECYYAQQNYPVAIEQFNKVRTNFANSDKTAAAILKIGYCYFNLGDSATGNKYLTSVIEKFPNSEEARLAKSRLSQNNR